MKFDFFFVELLNRELTQKSEEQAIPWNLANLLGLSTLLKLRVYTLEQEFQTRGPQHDNFWLAS